MDKPKRSETSDQPITPFWRHGWPDFDRAFENFRRDFERSLMAFPAINIPSISMASISCDVIDEGDSYIINSELPGVSKEDIKLKVSDNNVEISAEHKEEEEEKKKNYIRKERRTFSYHRNLPLPEKVDPSKAKAKFNNGILTVEILKQTPTPKPKTNSISIE